MGVSFEEPDINLVRERGGGTSAPCLRESDIRFRHRGFSGGRREAQVFSFSPIEGGSRPLSVPDFAFSHLWCEKYLFSVSLLLLLLRVTFGVPLAPGTVKWHTRTQRK